MCSKCCSSSMFFIYFFLLMLGCFCLILFYLFQEAIAGKCHVVCTSVDKRNLQPSSTDVELADYIFYRVFDVGNYTISDVLADTVAGIEGMACIFICSIMFLCFYFIVASFSNLFS